VAEGVADSGRDALLCWQAARPAANRSSEMTFTNRFMAFLLPAL
jgi:hypothetical protein